VTKRASYTNDFEGVYLSHTSFPKKINNLAASAVSKYKTEICIVASKAFTANSTLFRRVGLDKEDVTAILLAHTYAHLSKNSEPKYLKRFLKQRAIRLVETCERKSQGIAEETISSRLEEINFVHNENPEELLIAKKMVGNKNV
jgi:hypothetical protein